MGGGGGKKESGIAYIAVRDKTNKEVSSCMQSCMNNIQSNFGYSFFLSLSLFHVFFFCCCNDLRRIKLNNA